MFAFRSGKRIAAVYRNVRRRLSVLQANSGELVMRSWSNTLDEIPSLRIAQVELVRYQRTGSPLHLAHAQRALDDAQHELAALSLKRWRDDLTARLGGDVPGFTNRN